MRQLSNTEDKIRWCDNALEVEQDFVERICPRLGLDVIINPEKSYNRYAADLLRNSQQYADLKHQSTPYFTAQRLGVNPQYAVTFNHKDYVRYKNMYPEIHIYFWVRWDTLEGYGIRVHAMEGVWEVPFQELVRSIESNKLPLHSYQRRINDNNGNAKDSYVIDLRTLSAVRVRMPKGMSYRWKLKS